MICHEAFITQDGYDSGQVFVCEEHRVRVPVMDPHRPGRQDYHVTLDQMLELLYEHAKAVKAEEDAHPLLPFENKVVGEVVAQGFPVLVPSDTKEGDVFHVGSYAFVAGEDLTAGSQIRLDSATGRVVTA